MARLIVLFIIAFLLFAALRLLLAKKNLSVKQFFTIYLATLAGLILLFLGVTGRLHPLFALVGAVLPLAARLLPWINRGAQFASLFRFLKNVNMGPAAGQANSPQSSEIESKFLQMVLFHDTGMMDGTVRAGKFKDSKLSQLELAQLMELMQELQSDPDSGNLLAAYLDREHSGWQSAAGSQAPPQSSSEMTKSEALEILGVAGNATDDDIVQAHRRLIQKVHPDRGGSDYLAAKINAAKDFLLRS